MTMRLTPEQLAEIASKVETLDGTGVEIKLIQMHNHEVHLNRATGNHVIVGISRKDGMSGGNTR